MPPNRVMFTSPQSRVVAIYIAPSAAVLPTAREQVRALAGQGLENDRYCVGGGTWSHWPGTGRQVTLIDGKVVDSLARDMPVTAAQLRRNLVVDGVDLDGLIGQRFKVGSAEMVGVRPCEPCAHIEQLSARGLCAALKGRGGLRADITSGGLIRVGDRVQYIPGNASS